MQDRLNSLKDLLWTTLQVHRDSILIVTSIILIGTPLSLYIYAKLQTSIGIAQPVTTSTASMLAFITPTPAIQISLAPTLMPTQIPTPTLTPLPTKSQNACSLPLAVPVIVLEYFPKDPNRPDYLDAQETGWGGNNFGDVTVPQWEKMTYQQITDGITFINDATKYHGYKDPKAPQLFNFTVVDTKKFYTAIPKGLLTGGGTRYLPNYHDILSNNNICDYVDNKGVKEVWMYGYHNDTSGGIVPDESRMSSKYGDVSNSVEKEETLPTQYKLPLCKNSYVLYNFTYQPTGSIGNNIHNRMHQIENALAFAEGKWPPRAPDNTEGSTFWGDFSEYPQNDPLVLNTDGSRATGFRSSCGNTHIPPNWTNAKTQEYKYDMTQQQPFNCETWNPDDSKTTYITAGCERWGCTDLGFYKWFMQNIPGYNNGITYKGQKMRNWWEAMYDFQGFIDKGKSLYGESIVCN